MLWADPDVAYNFDRFSQAELEAAIKEMAAEMHSYRDGTQERQRVDQLLAAARRELEGRPPAQRPLYNYRVPEEERVPNEPAGPGIVGGVVLPPMEFRLRLPPDETQPADMDQPADSPKPRSAVQWSDGSTAGPGQSPPPESPRPGSHQDMEGRLVRQWYQEHFRNYYGPDRPPPDSSTVDELFKQWYSRYQAEHAIGQPTPRVGPTDSNAYGETPPQPDQPADSHPEYDHYDDGHGFGWGKGKDEPAESGVDSPDLHSDTGHYDDGHGFGWGKRENEPAGMGADSPDLHSDTGHYDDGHAFGWDHKTPANVMPEDFDQSPPRGVEHPHTVSPPPTEAPGTASPGPSVTGPPAGGLGAVMPKDYPVPPLKLSEDGLSLAPDYSSRPERSHGAVPSATGPLGGVIVPKDYPAPPLRLSEDGLTLAPDHSSRPEPSHDAVPSATGPLGGVVVPNDYPQIPYDVFRDTPLRPAPMPSPPQPKPAVSRLPRQWIVLGMILMLALLALVGHQILQRPATVAPSTSGAATAPIFWGDNLKQLGVTGGGAGCDVSWMYTVTIQNGSKFAGQQAIVMFYGPDFPNRPTHTETVGPDGSFSGTFQGHKCFTGAQEGVALVSVGGNKNVLPPPPS